MYILVNIQHHIVSTGIILTVLLEHYMPWRLSLHRRMAGKRLQSQSCFRVFFSQTTYYPSRDTCKNIIIVTFWPLVSIILRDLWNWAMQNYYYYAAC